MPTILPPYSKKHIIVLASLTFFLGLGLLAVWKLNLKQAPGPTTTQVQQVTDTATLRTNQSLQAPVALAQQGNAATAWTDGQVVIFDIRSEQAYAAAHLEGAMSVPLAWVHKAAIDKQATVIIYSDNQADSTTAQNTLTTMGIKAVYTLNQPLDQLKELGYTVYVAP